MSHGANSFKKVFKQADAQAFAPTTDGIYAVSERTGWGGAQVERVEGP